MVSFPIFTPLYFVSDEKGINSWSIPVNETGFNPELSQSFTMEMPSFVSSLAEER